MRQKIYDEGERQLTGFAMPGAYQPDGYQTGGYLTLAYQLPWFGLEPYAYGEIMQQMWEVGDLTLVASGGLNVRFTPSTMLKLQATQAFFFDWRKTSEGDPSDNNIAAGAARLVMAF